MLGSLCLEAGFHNRLWHSFPLNRGVAHSPSSITTTSTYGRSTPPALIVAWRAGAGEGVGVDTDRLKIPDPCRQIDR